MAVLKCVGKPSGAAATHIRVDFGTAQQEARGSWASEEEGAGACPDEYRGAASADLVRVDKIDPAVDDCSRAFEGITVPDWH